MGSRRPLRGVGLGLRHEFANELATAMPADIDFVEVTAEHYFRRGGRNSRVLRAVLEQVPAACHALNTNLGGPAPLDEQYLVDIRQFLDRHRIDTFSDHLCHSGDEDWMHNLMPIPFTDEAIRYTAGRIRRAQEIVERPIAVENISYLTVPAQRMSEAEFVSAVLGEADCRLMLDVNNLYINSINMGYDAEDFLEAMPLERIAYAHVAGHSRMADAGTAKGEAEPVYIDTHGHPIAEPVLRLLEVAYQRFGVFPTTIERDQNIPPMSELLAELGTVRAIQQRVCLDNRTARHPAGTASVAGSTVAQRPTATESFTEIQRQFTNHLRDPDNAVPPVGADRRRMRIYARAYRAKLVGLLERRMSPLAAALGRDESFALIDDYVRLPRDALGGKSSFEESFADYIKDVGVARGLPPFIPELADYCIRTMAIQDSTREIRDEGVEPEGDLLGGVPVFSELADVMAYEWPVHRIGAKFLPEAKPEQPVWLVVYRDRRGAAGYVELNRLAAAIALQVSDNAAGKTGQEILADIGRGNLYHPASSLMRAGLGVLEALRKRDIIIGVRAGTV